MHLRRLNVALYEIWSTITLELQSFTRLEIASINIVAGKEITLPTEKSAMVQIDTFTKQLESYPVTEKEGYDSH